MAEIAELRQRLSLLSEASLSINESLDFETVLQRVLDSARSLIGARYGLMLLYGEDRWIVDFVGSGVTSEQLEAFALLPNILSFHKYFDEYDRPVRLNEFHTHTRAQGLPAFEPPFPVNSSMPFLSVPVRHRGERLGIVYLCDRTPEPGTSRDRTGADANESGTAYSQDDEELVAMFASQAALVISNARRHREEQRARAHLETLINSAAVGVLVLDAATESVTSANREASRVFGGRQLAGLSVEELLAPVECERDGRRISREEFPAVRTIRTGEAVVAEEISIESTDGRRISVIVNATPVASDSGAAESVVVTMQDMTPLEELERLRFEFLGMVGHELRSPLAGIKGSVTTLLETQASLDPAEAVQYHRLINEQADYMRDLIGDLIDVVRIDMGTLTVSPERCDIADLVDEARGSFLSVGGRDNIRVRLAPDLPAVMADRRRVIQVLNNLLTNAARNSHEASPIRVDITREDVHVAISVTDNGKGVPPERLPFLFQKFAGAGSDPSRDLGLGLAICKGIVEAHGGRIWAESDGAGLGTRFIFTLLASDEPQGKTATRTGRTRDQSAHGQPRVLAVDDDPRTLKLVRDALESAGYEAVLTGDPDEALAVVEEQAPSAVILDLMLPGSDGLELMSNILAIHDVPVIFLSAYDQPDTIAEALSNGAVDYIVKPFSHTELAARVDASLRKQAGRPNPFASGDLKISFADRTVYLSDAIVDLTPTEYAVLAELAASAGVALTHDQLLQRVWSAPRGSDARPLRTVVKNIRQKLGETTRSPRFIQTVPHVGYRMNRSDPRASD